MQGQVPMSDVTMQDDGGVLASYQSHTDPFNSLELRGELLLKKMSMAINNSHLSMHTNKGAEAAASSNCFPRSAYSLQTRPLFSEKKGEVNVSPSLSNSIGSTSPTSTRTISSDDLAFNEFQFVAQGQQLQPQQQHLDQNQLGLEPSDFRQINSLHSSSLLDLLFGNEEIFSADENANAKSIKNEFRSKLQEQTMLQEHLRQLGQSQMQQFGQQPALLLQQLQQQQQQQRLPTDGMFSFQDFGTKYCRKSFQTTSMGRNLENHISVCSNIIAEPCPANTSGTTNKNSNKRSQAVSSTCLVKESISNRRAQPVAKASPSRQLVNSAPRELKADVKGNQNTTNSTFQYVKVVGGGIKRPSDKFSMDVNLEVPPKSKAKVELCVLHDYLDLVLQSRGYVTSKYSALELGYIKTPTPLQIASFGTAVCSANKLGDADRLKSILQCGLSANPMNKFGDSPFFMVCKRGLPELVKVFIDCGAEVHIADSLGRTPLHYVAWANPPNFEAAKIILKTDPRLLYVLDQHGKTPLDFVAEAHTGGWVKFIDSVTDSLWLSYAGNRFHPEPSKGAIPDPPNALGIKLAENVASGRTKPEEVSKIPRGQDTPFMVQ